MTDRHCIKCANFYPAKRYYAAGLDKPAVELCGFCLSRLVSTHAHIGLAQRSPITEEQRKWVFRWFLKTTYFRFHRRMSRGRAKKLLQFMGGTNASVPVAL